MQEKILCNISVRVTCHLLSLSLVSHLSTNVFIFIVEVCY